jgi:hypothetical protein
MTQAGSFIETYQGKNVETILKNGFKQSESYVFKPTLYVKDVELQCNGEDMGSPEDVLGMSFDDDAVDKLGMLYALPSDLIHAYNSAMFSDGNWGEGWIEYSGDKDGYTKDIFDYLKHVGGGYWDKASEDIDTPGIEDALAEYQFPDPDAEDILGNYPELEDDPEAYDTEYDKEMNEVEDDRMGSSFTVEFDYMADGEVQLNFADGSTVEVPLNDLDGIEEI